MADSATKTLTKSPARKSAATGSSLAATAAAATKRIIGAVVEKTATVQLPQAVSEIHVSPEDVIPAGTIITEEIAIEAGLDDDEIDALEDAGHVKFVDVYAIAAAPQG